MSRVEEIKPCPWCGGSAEPMREGFTDEDGVPRYTGHRVLCTRNKCLVRGPRDDKQDRAIEAWNRVASNAHDRDGYVLILAEDHARLCGSSARVQSLEGQAKRAVDTVIDALDEAAQEFGGANRAVLLGLAAAIRAKLPAILEAALSPEAVKEKDAT